MENSIHTVGFDGKRLVRNATGLGNYSRYVVDTLSRACPELQCRVYAAGSDAGLMAPMLERASSITLHGPATGLGRRMPSLWRTRMLGRQAAADGVDVFHGLSNEIPVDVAGKVPSVVTVHDVIWRRYPADYKAIDRKLYDWKYGSSARRADRVIAISECTARDLVADFAIDPARIDVIYQGVDPQFRPAEAAAVSAVRKAYGLPERYIIGVGTVQGRKNQLLAAQALRALPADVKLVLVGRRTDYAKEIDSYAASHGLGDRIVWLQGVPFSHLPALYTGAAVAAYPSRYEGFGLPVVEALSCGTPVIAATGSCLEEAGGPGAVYVNPDDADQFAHAAAKLLDDAGLRRQLAQAGAAHIQKFNTGQFAEKTLRAYQSAIQHFRQ